MQISFPVPELYMLCSPLCLDPFDELCIYKIHPRIVCTWSSLISVAIEYSMLWINDNWFAPLTIDGTGGLCPVRDYY